MRRIVFNKIVLILGDMIFLLGSFLVTFKLRYGEVFEHSLLNIHLILFGVIFIFWILIFWFLGIYELGYYQKKSDYLRDLLIALGVAPLMAIVFFYIFSPFTHIGPRTFLAINTVIFSIFFVGWHLGYSYLTLVRAPRFPIVLIGDQEGLQPIKEAIQVRPYFGYYVAGEFDGRSNQRIMAETLRQASMAVILNYKAVGDNFFKSIFAASLFKASFITGPAFYEFLTRKILLGGIGEVWFLENISGKDKKSYLLLKRSVDIMFGLLGFAVFFITYPLIAFAIKWESRGQVFYRQKRVGQNGQVFDLIKYRSMYVGAERDGPQWSKKGDPRITKVGAFLRRSRLDELPQVVNIIKGDMSIVGPRPERPEFVRMFSQEIPFYNQRTLVKPGLTGWGQINYKYTSTVDETREKLQYDLYYIKNKSLFLDLEIILKTIKIVLSRKGS